jgi:hypothetical protein
MTALSSGILERGSAQGLDRRDTISLRRHGPAILRGAEAQLINKKVSRPGASLPCRRRQCIALGRPARPCVACQERGETA